MNGVIGSNTDQKKASGLWSQPPYAGKYDRFIYGSIALFLLIDLQIKNPALLHKTTQPRMRSCDFWIACFRPSFHAKILSSSIAGQRPRSIMLAP